MYRSLVLVLLLWTTALSAQVLDEHLPPGPFPLTGKVFDGNGQEAARAKVYPQFVELYDLNDKPIGKVGILVEKGWARIHMVNADASQTLVGYAHKGQIFDKDNQVVGTYFWTPTYSYVYDPDGKRVGYTKCIAWPQVCSVGVAGYLLKLMGGEEGKTDEVKP
ncbi:MAG: hypothetical protein A2600_13990 [Candidatus Lambdaproteobacteria bacterium RIFOXYD1_FULL_56_27]|uniref:WG repeat-containing protein n=1 Tax=Candidatus Lambdaproteobacteria bacterium RIFOXYD2_FULL_56_26 TaxID=1817773 RepID=A0A1F6GNN8_9PROT|nr:MAG: hypothetical protein A2557_06215 [Candidatus Lambdaproteobacteria bacterium RIFOXYD2_FULL_56_26]OGG99900.1 MAG: hypothetical protein A2426_09950 [Candidatus Lambdaproteobacteria bacterium RIFOXYC1_FULL_56_13]OGH06299.1 MAG: hypothetical protein A2600_13990 [Candidatus Lambdaproteobacteria bacterium RIFOXYD1_FULL_56_27]